jgi:hypothetical protein
VPDSANRRATLPTTVGQLVQERPKVANGMTSSEKVCRSCGKLKAVNEFHRQTRATDGLQTSCIACNKRQAREQQWEKQGVNINYAEYERMVAEQAGRCAICGQKPDGRDLNVDHDRSSGTVRALLCASCDRGIDSFANDPTRLRRAAEYLVKHGRG